MRRACEEISRATLTPQQSSFFGRSRFDPDLRDFAISFVRLQLLRHRADYDPRSAFSQSAVVASIEEAERAIASLAAAPEDERSDLLALMLGAGRS